MPDKELKFSMSLRIRQSALILFVFASILAILAGCGEKPVVVVNGDRITENEFVGKLKETTGEQILQQMIDRQIIDDAFEKAGLV